MPSKAELIAPLFDAVPPDGLRPGDAATIDRLSRALGGIAGDDLETIMVGPYVQAQQKTGIDGFLEAWQDWLSPYERFRLVPEDLIESGDHLVTMVRQYGVPRGGGPEIEAGGAAVWTVRAGRLVRVEFHLDRAAALRAAGLEPG